MAFDYRWVKDKEILIENLLSLVLSEFEDAYVFRDSIMKFKCPYNGVYVALKYGKKVRLKLVVQKSLSEKFEERSTWEQADDTVQSYWET